MPTPQSNLKSKMPINYENITTPYIENDYSEEFMTICKMAKRNEFYWLQLAGINFWGDKNSRIRLIKYNEKIIGYFVYNWKSSNGYIENIIEFGDKLPSVWVEFLLIDKPFQNIGIGSYVMDKFKDIFRKEFGNHIKYVCYDVVKRDENNAKIIKFYTTKRLCKRIMDNRAGNYMFCEELNVDDDETETETESDDDDEFCDGCGKREIWDCSSNHRCKSCEIK